ncbi:MAG TPA: peptide deformylase [Longimicrobiales bacterium]|nr:peptide deformylase [Longimicrobiales bacterium]
MAVREIRLLGDPVLREPAVPVEAVDDELRALVADMMETMYDAEGVGLAAPQIGISRRIIVVDTHQAGDEAFALVNPRVVESAGGPEKFEEGCLSIPGLAELVERPTRVVVEALTPAGESLRMEAEGFLARVLQHEVDHLDGVLFIDRLSPLKRRLLLKRWKKLEEEREPTGSGL